MTIYSRWLTFTLFSFKSENIRSEYLRGIIKDDGLEIDLDHFIKTYSPIHGDVLQVEFPASYWYVEFEMTNGKINATKSQFVTKNA